jgi:hypothetical protein
VRYGLEGGADGVHGCVVCLFVSMWVFL